MVSYNPVIHETAERELNALTHDEQTRLKDTIHDVASTREPTRHEKVKPLEGQENLLRVRVGDLRAVVELRKPALYIYRVGYRANVYDAIDDEIENRRASA